MPRATSTTAAPKAAPKAAAKPRAPSRAEPKPPAKPKAKAPARPRPVPVSGCFLTKKPTGKYGTPRQSCEFRKSRTIFERDNVNTCGDNRLVQCHAKRLAAALRQSDDNSIITQPADALLNKLHDALYHAEQRHTSW